MAPQTALKTPRQKRKTHSYADQTQDNKEKANSGEYEISSIPQPLFEREGKKTSKVATDSILKNNASTRIQDSEVTEK